MRVREDADGEGKSGKAMSEDGRLLPLIERLERRRILCVGDLMLDRYVYGRAERMSGEAPIPILAVERESAMLGGAGNVVRNIVALGGQAILVALVGADEAGATLRTLIDATPRLNARLVATPDRPSTVKTRYVAAGQQLLRADYENTTAVSREIEQRLIHAAEEAVAEVDLVVLSDYAKGALSPRLIAAVVARARTRGLAVIADPKGVDFTRYRAVSLLKPNARELEAATGLPCQSDAEAEVAARRALTLAEADALLVTRSQRGMTLVKSAGPAHHIATRAREVFDVSGAGDTTLAALGLALAAGVELTDAAALANAAAGVVVGKIGTAVCYPEELAAALNASGLNAAESKILPLAPVLDQVARWRARGFKVGFTNGCFDLVHPGHVSLLAQARAACDRLVVGLNTDASVRRLKGDGRPVNSELARAIVLASLQTVDAVVLFDEDTPLRLIEAIRPDVLVKGADYTIDRVVGADVVQAYGGQVLLAALKPGHSTTGTLARLVGTQKAS